MSARTRRDWILMGALGCALVGTAHAEYTLALAAHFNEYVALAVPGALDLYVLRALQVRRDVFVAVLAMVAANVTAHLLTAGVLQEHWAITSAAGALAPLILWRVHSLKHTRTREELLLGLPAGTWSGAVHLPPLEHGGEYTAPVRTCSECGLMWDREHENWSDDPANPCPAPPAPDHVPASWMEEEYPETHPSAASAPALEAEDELGCVWGHDECAYSDGECVVYTAPAPASAPALCPLSEPFLRPLDDTCSQCGGRWGDHPGVQRKRAEYATHHFECAPSAPALPPLPDSSYAPGASALKVLHSVPDLPPEYIPSAVHSESPLTESDLRFLPGAQEYVSKYPEPSVRGLRREMKIGQDRAERLLTHLGVLL